MRLIDADILIDRIKLYEDSKGRVRLSQVIDEIGDLPDEDVSRRSLENLVESQADTISTYHKIFMLQEGELEKLREEAIKYLIKPVATSTEIGEEKQKEFEAYNMAISALSAEPSIPMFAESAEAYKAWTGEDMGKSEPSDKGGDAEINETKSPFMQHTPSTDGDLISRADAICEVLVNDGIDNIVDRINDLPSADAEPKRVLQGYCKGANCKWWNTQLNGCNRCVMVKDEYTHPSADRPTEILDDGTLVVKVPNAKGVGRVLVKDADENVHIGGGFYYHEDSADRPSGEWQDIDGDGTIYKCSNCNEISCCNGNYCPSCGARMENTK
ncbi:MAG: zinc ribbon domain-containing protein [Bacteroidota bacterium]|nr:zinc ribbon domain-containing protein [Bacteroidota bacterium]